MASLESKLFNLLLVLIKKKKFLDMQFAIGKFDFNSSREPPRQTQHLCDIEKWQFHGRNVFTLRPKANRSGRHILYFHGGAYVQNFVKQHWSFLGTLVAQTGCTITAPDYPLAPGFTYVDTYEMIGKLYEDIIRREAPDHIMLMGDSAGGGLALGLAQVLKARGGPTPAKVILLSPWLDITLSNPEIRDIDERDPFLGVNALRKAGLSFAGDSSPDNPMLSPIHGPLNGLGEIFIFIGSRDIMVADTRKLRQLAHMDNVVVNYREYDEMIHVWMFLSFPESAQARKEIIQAITL